MPSAPRNPAEYKGYLWKPTVALCPKCNAPTEALFSPILKKATALRCLRCSWTAKEPPTKPLTEAQAAALELRQWPNINDL